MVTYQRNGIIDEQLDFLRRETHIDVHCNSEVVLFHSLRAWIAAHEASEFRLAGHQNVPTLYTIESETYEPSKGIRPMLFWERWSQICLFVDTLA